MDTESTESTEVTETVETQGTNPFDGKVTDHSMAWSHVSAAYGISLAILLTYIVVVSTRLASARRKHEERT